jgi:hypothetical protein
MPRHESDADTPMRGPRRGEQLLSDPGAEPLSMSRLLAASAAATAVSTPPPVSQEAAGEGGEKTERRHAA